MGVDASGGQPQYGQEEAVEAYDPVFEFWVPGVLLTGVAAAGLVGNFLSIVILSRPAMASSITVLLLGLTSCDSLLILTSVLMFGLPSIHIHHTVHIELQPEARPPVFSYYMQSVFPYITPIIYPLGLVCQTCSVYLTVCVSVERFIAVLYPLQAKHLCTQSRARWAVVLTALISLGYNFPRFFEVSYQQLEDTNTTDVVPTSLRRNHHYIEVYVTWMYLIFMYILPFTLLAVLNLIIYREIRKATAIRNTLSRSQKREIGLAMMLLCVVLVFFLCNMPALVVNVLEHFGQMYNWLTAINNLLVTLNSSVNFVIYCIFGDKFKRIFTNLVLAMLGKETGVHTELLRYQSNIMAEHIQLTGRGGRAGSRRPSAITWDGRLPPSANTRRKSCHLSPADHGDISLLGESSLMCFSERNLSILSSNDRAA